MHSSLLSPGSQLQAGRYVVIGKIGEGTHSEIYSATDAVEGIVCALKLERDSTWCARARLGSGPRLRSARRHALAMPETLAWSSMVYLATACACMHVAFFAAPHPTLAQEIEVLQALQNTPYVPRYIHSFYERIGTSTKLVLVCAERANVITRGASLASPQRCLPPARRCPSRVCVTSPGTAAGHATGRPQHH